MPLISCENLCIGYGDKQIVENLTFCIEKGDYLCILGENGSGKSTLIKTLLHLNRPISGKLSYGDGLNNGEIGYLPQQTAAQKDFPASALEVVLSGTLSAKFHLPFYTAKQKSIARDNMESLGITNLADRCYRELSGGQQQRVLLARALCASSKLLLLDEPIAGLDPQWADEMYSTIRRLNRDGLTVIMVSHDTKVSLSDATHVLHIAHKPKFFGTVSDYLHSDAGKKYLGGGRII